MHTQIFLTGQTSLPMNHSWFYNYMVYNTFNIIDLILHINTHIIVLLAIFHILSNIRFKNTMMEL